MEKFRIWFVIYILSIILLVIDCGFFIYFLFHTTIPVMIICLCILAVSCCLYFISRKKLLFPGGYTLIQALIFMKKCTAAGYTKKSEFINSEEAVLKIAEPFRFSLKPDAEILYKVFLDGLKFQKVLVKKSKKK